ncbi:MAG TPA: 2-oxo-4-hydroxy-4-carboxy-5-ureidoimidazoline decarboxylase, partial [Marmoricola sp.]
LGDDEVAAGARGEESQRDQSTLGLTWLNETDHEAFGSLAAAYRAKFGIPLITCIRDAADKDQVLANGWARLDNCQTQEHAAALIEIAKIANHRFDDLVADANPIAAARTRRFEAAG